jgi:hypothetical protein
MDVLLILWAATAHVFAENDGDIGSVEMALLELLREAFRDATSLRTFLSNECKTADVTGAMKEMFASFFDEVEEAPTSLTICRDNENFAEELLPCAAAPSPHFRACICSTD